MERSIEEIKSLENSGIDIYFSLKSHSAKSDLRMKKINLKFISFLEKHLIKKGCRILDIGCGTGWLVDMFREKGYSSTGGDIVQPKVIKERYPNINYIKFDIFSPPNNPTKYDFIFIRALGPIEKTSMWNKIPLFDWLSSHISDDGIIYFIYGSNGSGVPDKKRLHCTSEFVKNHLKLISNCNLLYYNVIGLSMTFVLKKTAMDFESKWNKVNYSKLINTSFSKKEGFFYYLLHGLPVMVLPSDDLPAILDYRKTNKLLLFDYYLILRSYPLKLAKFIVRKAIK
jgi:SAM-dependent methyltransferase